MPLPRRQAPYNGNSCIFARIVTSIYPPIMIQSTFPAGYGYHWFLIKIKYMHHFCPILSEFPKSNQKIHVHIENIPRMYHFLSAPGGSEQVCVVCGIIRMCTFLKYHINMYKEHVFDDYGEISIGIGRVSFFEHKEMCTFLTFCTHLWRFSWNPYRYLTSMVFVRIVEINMFWTILCVTSFSQQLSETVRISKNWSIL